MNPTLTLFSLGRNHRFWWRAQIDRITRWIAGIFARPVPVPVRTRASRAALLILAGVLVAGSAPAARAARWDDNGYGYGNRNYYSAEDDRTADGQLVDVQLLVQGQPAPLFVKPDVDRWYFQAFEGRNYAIRLRNNTGQRVGVLIAVDGLNVVNGEQSDLSNQEPMYVLDPWETATIRGWRTSQDQVRKFVFVDEERLYANRTDQANGDMGWIRVLAFREYRPQAWGPGIRDFYRGGQQAPAPEAPQLRGQAKGEAPRDMAGLAPDNQGNPGTGWGDRRYDPVRKVWFQPESVATDQLILRYEYESGLRALGIFPQAWRNRTWERERGEVGYAQPPRW